MQTKLSWSLFDVMVRNVKIKRCKGCKVEQTVDNIIKRELPFFSSSDDTNDV